MPPIKVLIMPSFVLELKKLTSAMVSVTYFAGFKERSFRTMLQIKLNSKDFITSFFSTISSANYLRTLEESSISNFFLFSSIKSSAWR